MNETDKDRHIASLEKRVCELEKILDDSNDRLNAITAFLMDPDPSDPTKGSRATRMMGATRFLEQCNWLVKILMYVSGVILGIGTAVSAAKGWFIK